jgi:nitrate reductase alpha subunit
MIRKRLIRLWRSARQIAARGRMGLDPERSGQAQELYRDPWPWRFRSLDMGRGQRDHRGGQCLYGANLWAGSVIGFSPIPAMSMVSYAAGARYLSLLGGTCLSFYDWYCDLPPSSPMTWGEQTDVCESADWYNAGFLMLWGSTCRKPHPGRPFHDRGALRGAKVAVVSPDYAEATKFADLWLNPKQGTDAALALAMGHVILREFHLDRQVPYFEDYCRRYSDMPMLVRLVELDGRLVPERLLRASDFAGNLARATIRNGNASPSTKTATRW